MTRKQKLIKELVEKEITRIEEQLLRKPENTIEPDFWNEVERDLKALKGK